ncbi:hypothetical protein CAPTEDRAFT_209229 [Capitella teleta]|uniref:Uncharacterized protein n=1 Tax=Capitella teleta TaxID=283909 RepID=R7VME0_CAPTE|nr:hypothetical protein CAPTEDRAFT_209229 [Capitella teleta]|eukprot:ELU18675.1 hypothetical protein CAPTEDRAFT_209229 [Capitella teleta]
MKPEQERLVAVLKDTVSLLCKNSLTFEEQVVVQGVICITVDKQDVLVVPVHESIGQAEYEPCVACGHAKQAPPGSPHQKQLNNSARKRKRRRRSSSGGSPGSPATYDEGQREEEQEEEDEEEAQQRVKIKKEEQEEISDDEDLILIDEDIKREHNDSDMSFITGYMDNSQLSSITATPQQQQQHHQQQQLQQQQHFQGPSSWQSNPASSSAASQLEMPEGAMPDGMAASQKVLIAFCDVFVLIDVSHFLILARDGFINCAQHFILFYSSAATR